MNLDQFHGKFKKLNLIAQISLFAVNLLDLIWNFTLFQTNFIYQVAKFCAKMNKNLIILVFSFLQGPIVSKITSNDVMLCYITCPVQNDAKTCLSCATVFNDRSLCKSELVEENVGGNNRGEQEKTVGNVEIESGSAEYVYVDEENDNSISYLHRVLKLFRCDFSELILCVFYKFSTSLYFQLLQCRPLLQFQVIT